MEPPEIKAQDTLIKVEVQGRIADGPIIGPRHWESDKGRDRKVVGYRIFISRDDATIRLLTKRVLKDGTLFNEEMRTVYAEEDRQLPEIRELESRVESMVDRTDWDNFFNTRPAFH